MIFGLLSVWLSIRKSLWCWPTGLVNVVCFFVMFYQVKLYAELITYAVFFVLGIYGWWQWSHRGELLPPVARLCSREETRPCLDMNLGSLSASSSLRIWGTNI